MNMDKYIELGAIGILFAIAIREFFAWLKTRKNGNGNGNGFNKQLLDAITTQNQNHLTHINVSLDKMCADINCGNDRVVKAITDMHIDLASRLGELKGKIK